MKHVDLSKSLGGGRVGYSAPFFRFGLNYNTVAHLILMVVFCLLFAEVNEVRAESEEPATQTIGGDNCGTNCHWEINNGVLSISAINPNEPATMSDYIYGYSRPWADYKEQISSVNVNDVTNIGKYAFLSLGLSSISIGESVETIGESAFRSNQLSRVIIPENVKQIEESAFTNQKKEGGVSSNPDDYTLKYVELPKGVDLAGTDHLANGVIFDRYLTTISIPDTITAEDVAKWDGAAFGNGYNGAQRYITNIECRGENGQPGDDSKCYAALAGKFIRDENGRCTAFDGMRSTCLYLVEKIGQTCLNNKLNKEGECIESSACTGEYLISGNQCIKMPGCLNFANGACGGCESGYYKKGTGCVLATEGCGSGWLEKKRECIEASKGCGDGYKDLGGWCNRVIYTPAEAAEVLNNDNTNFITITFRK